MLTREEQEAFLISIENVQQAAERHLSTHRSQQFAIEFVSNLQRGVSRAIQMAIEQGVKVACKAGCSHCCYARVEAMAPEIFRIARELEGRSAEERNHLVHRVTTHVLAQSETIAWDQRTACPFLISDLCSIYDVRPSRCRKAHSLDVNQCRANAPAIPQDLGTVLGAEAMIKGTSDAYRRLGFNESGHELGGAVLLALSDPSSESRWYSGEAVFGPDVGGSQFMAGEAN
jgi:hypothetical protein